MTKSPRRYRHREDYDDFKKMRRPGWQGGYSEYRYGQRKPISLAPVWKTVDVKPDTLIDRAARLLKPWVWCRWEKEAAVRTGLRLAMIEKGNGWQEADDAAAYAVRQAFNRLGRGVETRPSHDEGQRFYTTPFENCTWCGADLPSRSYSGKRRDRFCGNECAEKALKFFDWDENNANGSIIGQAAYRMTARAHAVKFRTCGAPGCGNEFPIISSNPNQRYCSTACRDATMRGIPDRHCKNCRELFRPARSEQIFCGTACAQEYRDNHHKVEKVCAWCNGRFFAKTTLAKYCSVAHKKAALRAAKKASQQRLTPEMFDGWFLVWTHPVHRLFET